MKNRFILLLLFLSAALYSQEYTPNYCVLEKESLLVYDSVFFFHPEDLKHTQDIGQFMKTHYIFSCAEAVRCFNCPVLDRSEENFELKRVALVWFEMDGVYIARNLSDRDIVLNLLNFTFRKNNTPCQPQSP